jgi:aminopeptidase YwaD
MRKPFLGGPSCSSSSAPKALVLASLLLSLGCPAPKDTQTTAPAPAPATAKPQPQPAEPPALVADAARLRTHVEFLAHDEQLGRPPGTDADRRVQDYIEAELKLAGLRPAFGDGYRQPFEVTDGVRATGEPSLALGKQAVPFGLVPFTGVTHEPVSAPLVFVGHGIASEGKGTGDYQGLEAAVKGKIVVALGGMPKDDPHASVAVTRPQSKLIAARDHGAVGFILWEPDQEVPYPNHGEANDLGLPAVWVGKPGSEALLRALGGKPKLGPKGLKAGTKGKGKASIHTPVEPIVLSTANVSGVLPGREGAPVLVVGAHMDHLGEGTSSSLAPGVKAVHNGADDNASGVAVILELARVLGALPVEQRPYTVHFVAFGAEEMGLLGSKHYVEHLDPVLRGRMVAMINFDMVGRLGGEQGLVIAGMGTSSVWPRLVDAARGEQDVRASDDGYGASDQTSFYEAGLPVLHFFTGTHSDYHKPSDDVDKLNFAGTATVAGIALRVIHALSTEGITPDYIKVARTAPARGGFKVSLGTIPDYGAKVDGVRLTGVREGGAAAKAGLQKGDVIQKIGEREIHNLDDYMATFAVLEPGVEIEVAVERDGQGLTVRLVPDAPARR